MQKDKEKLLPRADSDGTKGSLLCLVLGRKVGSLGWIGGDGTFGRRGVLRGRTGGAVFRGLVRFQPTSYRAAAVAFAEIDERTMVNLDQNGVSPHSRHTRRTHSEQSERVLLREGACQFSFLGCHKTTDY